jgi:hypothetical protein
MMTVMTVTKYQSEVTEELVYYEHNCINGLHTDVRVVLRRLKSDLQDINIE